MQKKLIEEKCVKPKNLTKGLENLQWLVKSTKVVHFHICTLTLSPPLSLHFRHLKRIKHAVLKYPKQTINFTLLSLQPLHTKSQATD